MQSLSRDADKLKGKATASYEQATRSCDEIIAELDHLRALVERDGPATLIHAVPQAVNKSKAATDAALASHKEYYSQLSKWQKAVDKKFNQTVLPLVGGNDDPSTTSASPTAGASKEPVAARPFESVGARRALDKVIAAHLVRQGRFDVADVFMSESGIRVPAKDYLQCRQLHRILDAIRLGDLGPALEWAGENRAWLVERASPLEYDLHRSHFIRLLTDVDGSAPTEDRMAVDDAPIVNGGGGTKPRPVTPAEARARRAALAYGQKHFPAFFPTRWQESVRLTSSVLYAPLDRMRHSPYSDLVAPPASPSLPIGPPAPAVDSPWLHAHHLVPLFAKEFSARSGWSRELPLVVATDMGSGGALAKIAKVRSVMKEKRTEWSQSDELPVEITLPVPYRFHSVFACPVSKEQTTLANPPMMMVCGHVISQESLTKLARGGGTVKCPYCPSSASMSQAMQVYF